MSFWATVHHTLDDTVHVIPCEADGTWIEKPAPHEASMQCWCKPTNEGPSKLGGDVICHKDPERGGCDA
jgi:hypothetical protein